MCRIAVSRLGFILKQNNVLYYDNSINRSTLQKKNIYIYIKFYANSSLGFALHCTSNCTLNKSNLTENSKLLRNPNSQLFRARHNSPKYNKSLINKITSQME